eukprot:CAMPEP_0177617000 /NCGR_PEP_ID=MMETSP0419_2-20121207/24574_1 /TAXON_ID=582737 /ORGANISM="Tetraselmis sp., Strain GSL018" /LENGTH=71 /DNA_ID=CAMNT_0019115333 /DNA_START=14 /DNA_END=225 /DNA_ORIENTATION=+
MTPCLASPPFCCCTVLVEEALTSHPLASPWGVVTQPRCAPLGLSYPTAPHPFGLNSCTLPLQGFSEAFRVP